MQMKVNRHSNLDPQINDQSNSGKPALNAQRAPQWQQRPNLRN
jgi:hypothetical protein